MKTLRFTLLILLAMLAVAPVRAQLTVDLNIKRRMFISHEPILATVTIRNLSGRDLILEDTAQMPWFSFQVNTKNDRIVPLDAARTRYERVGSKRKQLKIFTAEEGGAEHCQVDHRQLGIDYIGDWLLANM